jgi:L-amino acid N-acyltransferase YncA
VISVENEGFSIRQVKEEDAKSIIELLNPIIIAENYTTLDEPLSVSDQADFIRNYSKRGLFHVAVSNKNQEVLGIQDVQPIASEGKTHNHIGEIATFVSLTSHRKGIGKSLSKITFKAAKELGYRKLMASIRGDNPQALSFYQSQGFRTIGTAVKHAFVGGKYIDQIFAEKLID